MKRYNLERDKFEDAELLMQPMAYEDPDGEWVRWEDVRAALDEIEKKLDILLVKE